MIIPGLDGIVLGCDYNPEQWGRAVWQEDIALMRELGVGLVAVNIFGWAQLNPAKGVWDFADLDEIIGLLHEAGIRVNLGTATASTPAWLTTRHPEMLPTAIDGTRRFPGGRQAFCPSSPVYRRYALTLVERIAERYGRHPAIALWHVSNELGCHNALCYCGDSAEVFREWLRGRYGSVERLNHAWGTAFWSQRYGGWDEILPPLDTLSTRNPAQVVDFHRFSSDALLDHFRAEAEVIRRHSDRPVTTNLMNAAHIQNMDYWSWASELDIIANDHYLDHRLEDPGSELAFAADLTRGLADGRPWMLMETSTGAVNWQPVNLPKAPGQLLRNALTHVARGADAICFFQWRASVRGSEKFHSALLPHAGTDSSTWREAKGLSGILRALSGVVGTVVHAEAAILFSWQAWWASEDESLPSQEARYLEQVHAAYRALRAAGVTVDVVSPGSDLTGYRLVVVPALYSLRAAEAAALHGYVAQGGHAFVTFFSGIVDEEQAVVTGGYPGLLRDLLGVRMDEFAPLARGERVGLTSGRSASIWSECGRATTAVVLDAFAEGTAAGSPAITRNAFGSGSAWYVATRLDQPDLDAVVRDALIAAGIAPLADRAHDLDVTRRVGADGTTFLFAINHADDDLELVASGIDLGSGDRLGPRVVVPAGGVRVIREDIVSASDSSASADPGGPAPRSEPEGEAEPHPDRGAVARGVRRFYADPALVAFEGRYYLYPTTDGYADWSADAFRVLVSDDLRVWSDQGEVLRLGRDVSWASRNAWAPAAAEKDGVHYLYFTAEDSIGVASAPTPTGPFTDSGRPLVRGGDHPGRAIDPSVFTDDDGTRYLVWGNGVANIARLNPDMISIDTTSVISWEHPTFREAAHVHRRGGRYYLTWSENDTRDVDYRVRWASGPSPSGPWEERGVLLEQSPENGIRSTGHHSILRIPDTDEWVIAYHRFAIPHGDGFHREIVIDPLHHLPSGDLEPVTPSLHAIQHD